MNLCKFKFTKYIFNDTKQARSIVFDSWGKTHPNNLNKKKKLKEKEKRALPKIMKILIRGSGGGG